MFSLFAVIIVKVMQSIAEQEVTNAALLRIMCFFLTSDIVGLAVRLMRLSTMIRNYVLPIKRKHLLICIPMYSSSIRFMNSKKSISVGSFRFNFFDESTRAISFNEYHLFYRLA